METIITRNVYSISAWPFCRLLPFSLAFTLQLVNLVKDLIVVGVIDDRTVGRVILASVAQHLADHEDAIVREAPSLQPTLDAGASLFS